jgi:hypothetical protein
MRHLLDFLDNLIEIFSQVGNNLLMLMSPQDEMKKGIYYARSFIKRNDAVINALAEIVPREYKDTYFDARPLN